jgi:hypothetical protein
MTDITMDVSYVIGLADYYLPMAIIPSIIVFLAICASTYALLNKYLDAKKK